MDENGNREMMRRTDQNPGREPGGSSPHELHGGRRDAASRRFGLPKEEFLDFSASINLLGPPDGVERAMRRAMTAVAHYPDADSDSLVEAVSGYLGVFPDEIVLGNGSIEVIYWLTAHLRPRRVLAVEPTFSEYRRAAVAAGAEYETLELSQADGFALDVLQVEPEGYDIVFLCNPNNPTGCLVPIEEVAMLWRNCRKAGTNLVIDEAFMDFAQAGQSILSYGVSDGLYVVRSFTKSHGIPGLRLGCMVGPASAMSRLQATMPPWNVNAFARAAGEAAVGDWRYLENTRRTTAAARQRLFTDIDAIAGIEPLPSETNFILCRLDGIGSGRFAELMGRQGILVRDCSSFPVLGDGYIRLAVRSERDNYQLVSTIKRVLEGCQDEQLVEGAHIDSRE